MTADELRAAADEVLDGVASIVGWIGLDLKDVDTPATRCAHAAHRLADAIEYAESIEASEGAGADIIADRFLRIARGESTNEREKP